MAVNAKRLQTKQADKDDFKESRSAFSGLRIEELKKLVIPAEVMREGLLFIWAEKELIGEILMHFEAQGFEYVENLVYVMLDKDLKNGKCPPTHQLASNHCVGLDFRRSEIQKHRCNTGHRSSELPVSKKGPQNSPFPSTQCLQTERIARPSRKGSSRAAALAHRRCCI